MITPTALFAYYTCFIEEFTMRTGTLDDPALSSPTMRVFILICSCLMNPLLSSSLSIPRSQEPEIFAQNVLSLEELSFVSVTDSRDYSSSLPLSAPIQRPKHTAHS
jgi:hypothetical protein